VSDFVKATEILGQACTVSWVGERADGAFGPEIVYELTLADGSERTVTLKRNQGRELTATKIALALEASPGGVPFTMQQAKSSRPGFKGYVYVEQYEDGTGGKRSAGRAWKVPGAVLPVAPEAVTVVPDEAFD
jgi:hypothetical protein